MIGLGIDEACTYSLVAEPVGRAIEAAEAVASLRVEHSSRKLENALRQSLTPSLLEARGYNEAHGNADADLFEIAHVSPARVPDGGLPSELTRLAIVAGRDLLGLKGIVEAVLDLTSTLAADEQPAGPVAAPGSRQDGRIDARR